MSFWDHIRAVNQHDVRHFLPFYVDEIQVGFIRPAFAKVLRRWPEIFVTNEQRVKLAAYLATPSLRTAAVHEVLQALRQEGWFPHWRDEWYPVNRWYHESPYFLLERAAAPFFGIRAYGVHVNGYVCRAPGLQAEQVDMWLGQRALDKPSEPGKLDQIVAGGQPANMTLMDNVIKECWEEAGIPESLACLAKPVGAISYCLETTQGLRPNVVFNFDLELPDDFIPVNRDKEVEQFYRWPLPKVMDTVCHTNDFKHNCALVVIDFLIRHGWITPEHPDYLALCQGLAVPGPFDHSF